MTATTEASREMRAERSIIPRWPIVLAVWTVPALLAAFETFMFWTLSGRNYPFWRAVVMEGPAWLTYAAATPLVFALGRRFPLHRPKLSRHLALHLLLSLVVGAAYSCVATATTVSFTPTPVTTPPFVKLASSWFLSGLPLTTLTYFGILGVGMALTYLAEARRREMDAASLSRQLAEARLGALRMQLHPHFLFNTLNAITVLAKDGDTTAVARMLELLSGLLRDVLRTDATRSVPLRDELEFSRRYLAIEHVRFGDRLHVRESVEAGTEDALVPVFILQPLIENALRHGVAPRGRGGNVELSARRVGGALGLSVTDDGVGLPSDWDDDDSYGIGLSNVAERLRELYGDHASLVVARRAGGGTSAMVSIPLA